MRRTATEAELAAVWADVLGVAEVGVHDDFYALGGDSILMLRIRAAAQRRGLGFELADLMRNPTVAGLAERLVRPLAEQATSRSNWFPKSTSRAWKGWRTPSRPAG